MCMRQRLRGCALYQRAKYHRISPMWWKRKNLQKYRKGATILCIWSPPVTLPIYSNVYFLHTSRKTAKGPSNDDNDVNDSTMSIHSRTSQQHKLIVIINSACHIYLLCTYTCICSCPSRTHNASDGAHTLHTHTITTIIRRTKKPLTFANIQYLRMDGHKGQPILISPSTYITDICFPLYGAVFRCG